MGGMEWEEQEGTQLTRSGCGYVLGATRPLKVSCDDGGDHGAVDERQRFPSSTWEWVSMGAWSGRSRRAGI